MNQLANETSFSRGTLSAHEYRPDVDGLRAIAVSAVIAYHFYSGMLPSGFLGVDMFFVISGYVITASLEKAPYKTIGSFFLNFYYRRVKRILPALVVCVLVTCLIGALFINPHSEVFSSSMTAGIFSLFGLSNIYFSRAATDYFGSATQLNLFTHTWSLGVEEQFYVVFPALLWISGHASGRRPRGRGFILATLSLLTILSFSLYIWLNKTTANGSYFLMPPRFWELGIGCMIALTSSSAILSNRYRLKQVPWFGSVLLVLALLAPAGQQLYATPAIVIATAIIIVTLRPDTILYQLLTLRFVLWVGLMSYSLYLWHWSVLSISRWTIGIRWWSVPVQIGLILALAAASYVFVERPLRRAQWSPSKLATIGFGMVTLVFSAGLILILKSNDTLYTGVPVHFEGLGIGTLLADKWYAGKIEWHANDCILSSDSQVGKKIDEDTCTIGDPTSTKRRFVVVGNSFSAAEFEMYSALAESGLGSVTATSLWGASPVPEIPNNGPWSKANAYYWNKVVPRLISHLNEGDILISINDIAGFAPATPSIQNQYNLTQLRTGLERLAKELRQKGIQIIFQSADPFMRESQCTPEMANPQWFNIGATPSCVYYTKTSSLKRRQPLQDVLEAVESANQNFHVLDLFPILCPDDTCKFYNNQGVFLYRDDNSHLSIGASYLARPLLLAAVNRAIKTSDNMSRATSTSR
jgi:peptidoglycan/LPS O-acetylase OafA/YrhL